MRIQSLDASKRFVHKTGQYVSAFAISPTEKQARMILFGAGILILIFSLTDHAMALQGTQFNQARITNAYNAVMAYLEGTFGALVMACAGIGAIMSAAFGQYKACLSLMVVAIGAFILRSFISTFFNTEGAGDH